MMVVAALCEHQNAEVASVKTPAHGALSLGIRRAAAPGGPLPGDKLLALLRADRWDALLRLGEDNSQYHRLPRGLRPATQPQSKTLKDLDKAATDLLVRGNRFGREATMSYDADIENEQLSYNGETRVLDKNTDASSKDLGVIVTSLEVAALSLTYKPGATFTLDQLVHEAREICGNDLDEKAVKTVLKKARFIKKKGKQYFLR
jgi:hypothetical protein